MNKRTVFLFVKKQSPEKFQLNYMALFTMTFFMEMSCCAKVMN